MRLRVPVVPYLICTYIHLTCAHLFNLKSSLSLQRVTKNKSVASLFTTAADSETCKENRISFIRVAAIDQYRPLRLCCDPLMISWYHRPVQLHNFLYSLVVKWTSSVFIIKNIQLQSDCARARLANIHQSSLTFTVKSLREDLPFRQHPSVHIDTSYLSYCERNY